MHVTLAIENLFVVLCPDTVGLSGIKLFALEFLLRESMIWLFPKRGNERDQLATRGLPHYLAVTLK